MCCLPVWSRPLANSPGSTVEHGGADMKIGSSAIAAAIGAAIAPLILVAIPAGSASAHGYIDSPPSRQAQCAQGLLACGDIKYEPQSVEGPKGLRSCSGGNARF